MKLTEYSLLGDAFKGGPFEGRQKVVERGEAEFGSTHADRRSTPAPAVSTAPVMAEGRQVKILKQDESFTNSAKQVGTNFVNIFR
jgi:hypothetical protein